MASQLRALNDEERVKRFEQWADRIEHIAESLCNHTVKDDAEWQHPCPECIRVVDFVTKQWADVMAGEYNRAARIETPVVMRWHTAYRTAGSVLEPAWAMAVDPIGPL